MALRRLCDLERSSAEFPGQLDQFFHDEKNVECIQNLPEGELAEFLNYLSDVLGTLDRTGQPFRKCFQVLQKICGSRATLPLSYQALGIFSYMNDQPVAFGGSCDIYKGKDATGADVCIKKIRIHTIDDIGEIRQSFCKEAVVWKHLNHPNIAPFLGVTLEPLQLVSEWMPGGELREHLGQNPNANPVHLLIGVAEGLEYLHSCHVIHGDLKGPNVLVDESGNARITDFGLTTIARNPHSNRTTLDEDRDRYTTRWCAPELLFSGQAVSEKSDIFSFGMIIIEVFTGKIPFCKFGAPAVIARITAGKIPDRPNHPRFTDDLWELTQRCLEGAPSDRPTAGEVLATLKRVDRGGGYFAGQVGVETQGPKNKTSSAPSLPPRDRTVGRPPIRQRRNAGAKPPGIGLGEKFHTREGFDDEICSTPDDLKIQNNKPKDRPDVCPPVKNLCSPPHLLKWPDKTEKVPLVWQETVSSGSESVSTPIQPQSRPLSNMKKHGLWCRIKIARGITSVFRLPSRLVSFTGFICGQ